MPGMDYLWAALLVVLNAGWLLAAVAGLPGAWLMIVSTALLAWWKGPDTATGAPGMFSVATLIVVAALALAGEIAEFFTGVVGSKAAGGTKRGATGALLGGFAGALIATFTIPLPIVGTVIGACGGAALGALIAEFSGGRTFGAAAKSGVGAGLGTLAGRIVKIAVSALIWLIIAIAAFWP